MLSNTYQCLLLPVWRWRRAWHVTGPRDIRDTCDGGQWGVEMCRDQATSWHVSHVWWMDTCPGPGVITLSTARGDRKYIYISPGIMISGSMVMMIAASSTVQWQYLSWRRRFHDVGVSSPSERRAYFEDIVSKMWEHFINYLHFSVSWIVWLLVTEPSFSSVVALMGICVLWTALVHSPQRPKNLQLVPLQCTEQCMQHCSSKYHAWYSKYKDFSFYAQYSGG